MPTICKAEAYPIHLSNDELYYEAHLMKMLSDTEGGPLYFPLNQARILKLPFCMRANLRWRRKSNGKMGMPPPYFISFDLMDGVYRKRFDCRPGAVSHEKSCEAYFPLSPLWQNHLIGYNYLATSRYAGRHQLPS